MSQDSEFRQKLAELLIISQDYKGRNWNLGLSRQVGLEGSEIEKQGHAL